MEKIAHRRNRTAELIDTPITYGVEVDIRSIGDRLVIHHDPYVEGEAFAGWLEHYRHGTLILNVKEEGLETRLVALMAMRGIERYFFLDQSFPCLLRAARAGERRCAVRVSEFESIATALAVAQLIDWVWVDYFSRFPLDSVSANQLREAGLKLCLVSPELQGRPTEEIAAMRRLLDKIELAPDAVCTKRPDLW